MRYLRVGGDFGDLSAIYWRSLYAGMKYYLASGHFSRIHYEPPVHASSNFQGFDVFPWIDPLMSY